MSQFSVLNPAGRIMRLKGAMLKYAIPVEVLGMTGEQSQMPRNMGMTTVYRRWIPFGGALTNSNTINRWSVDPAAHQLSEGIPPDADTLVPQDITVALQEYGCLYSLSNRTEDLYEDDVSGAMKKQCGLRIGLVREMIRWGTLKAGTNAYYVGGSSRAAVNGKISLNILRRIARTLRANHAAMVTDILAPAALFNTSSVEAAYLVFVHTDAIADVRDLPDFTKVADYGSRKTVSPHEIGTCEEFRFVCSPELNSYANAGAAVGTTGMFSTGNSTIDVYPFVVCGENAWGQVALRGEDSLDPTYIPPSQKTKDDPLGQKGYVGASFYMNCVRTNEGWMAVCEAGVSALT